MSGAVAAGNGAPPAWFSYLLALYPRIAIAGGPRTGKTSLAGTVHDRPVLATDDLINSVEWDDVPDALIAMADKLGPSWVIEGVQVARALRRGMRPDAVVYLTKQHGGVSPRQVSMWRAVGTVFEQWDRMNRRRIPVARMP